MSITVTIPTVSLSTLRAKASSATQSMKQSIANRTQENNKDAYIKELEQRIMAGYVCTKQQAALTQTLVNAMERAGITDLDSPYETPHIDTAPIELSLINHRAKHGL